MAMPCRERGKSESVLTYLTWNHDMIGEAWVATQYAERRLRELRDEREMFALWGEDALHPFVYRKKLDEYDALIESYESDLMYWDSAYREIIESEADEEESWLAPAPDPFLAEFEELCRIDGVTPTERFDRIITARELSSRIA